MSDLFVIHNEMNRVFDGFFGPGGLGGIMRRRHDNSVALDLKIIAVVNVAS